MCPKSKLTTVAEGRRRAPQQGFIAEQLIRLDTRWIRLQDHPAGRGSEGTLPSGRSESKSQGALHQVGAAHPRHSREWPRWEIAPGD